MTRMDLALKAMLLFNPHPGVEVPGWEGGLFAGVTLQK